MSHLITNVAGKRSIQTSMCYIPSNQQDFCASKTVFKFKEQYIFKAPNQAGRAKIKREVSEVCYWCESGICLVGLFHSDS